MSAASIQAGAADVVPGPGTVGRIRNALGEAATTVSWRRALAVAVAALVYWTTAGGSIMYVPAVQVALVVGLAAGLVAPGWLSAAAAALLACILGSWTGPVNFWLVGTDAVTPAAVLPWAVLAGAVAALVAEAIARRWARPAWVFWLAVAIVLVNVWVTVIAGNSIVVQESRTGVVIPALTDLIEGAEAPPAMRRADDFFYLIVDRKLRSGVGYYEAASGSFQEVGDGSVKGPSGILNLRQPLLYVLLSRAPSATWLYGSYLTLVSAAALSALWVTRDIVRTPLVLPAICAVATYTVPFATSLQIYYTELWAGPLALLSFSAFCASLGSKRWKTWIAASVALAVVAFLVRELAGTLFIAAFVAALLGQPDRRRWTLGAWGVGALVAAAAYMAHVAALRPYLTGAPGQGVWGRGGLEFALAATTNNTIAFGTTLAVVLAAMSYLGALGLPDAARRGFALVVLVVPLVVFLLVGNGATDTLTGGPVNYWGAVIMPTAYACLPAVFSVVPGAAPAKRLSGPAVVASAAGAQ